MVYTIDTTWSFAEGARRYELDTSNGRAIQVCLLSGKQKEGDICTLGTLTDVDGKFEIQVPEQNAQEYRHIEFTTNYAKPIAFGLSDNAFDSLNIFFVRPEYINTTNIPAGPVLGKERRVSKPAIYLYPTRKTEVAVKHTFKGKIGTTYPAYGDGWKVVADTNGALYNLKDKRQYEYLFWDGTYRFPNEHYNFETGFVVKKQESQAFLWEKLALIGLNNKEINDFVVYWLPQLEQNEQNFIHFRINDDIDHTSILEVKPEPDSRIRLFMEFKPVGTGFRIQPQSLQPFARKGFTLVEWGGARLEEVLSIQ